MNNLENIGNDRLRRLMENFGSYTHEIKEFIQYLENNNLGITPESIKSYIKSLQYKKKRIKNKDGKIVKTDFSNSWFNQRMKGVRKTIRFWIENNPDINNGEKFQVQKFIDDNIKFKKLNDGISKPDVIPDSDEVKLLIEKSSVKLGLIIRFLVESLCRISECLSTEVSKCRPGNGITYIKILGKGSKERNLKISTELYKKCIETFQGKIFLFEHSGKQYSRISVSNRIKSLAECTIKKSSTAHSFRHFRGMTLTEKYGICKACDELGHKSIETTRRFYAKNSISNSEYLESISEFE